ncbi:hypothetical protein LCGC14_0263650 [marine sediment metagenome]|uniref:Uncharacterized protein n=1 Tax=marine sediment metagenome TaxID=412755 RepID=A0A0F9WLB1_9ZZZZ
MRTGIYAIFVVGSVAIMALLVFAPQGCGS